MRFGARFFSGLLGFCAVLCVGASVSWAAGLPSLNTFRESAGMVAVPKIAAVALIDEDFEFDFDQQALYYKTHGLPLDWASLAGGQARAVYIGEPHFVEAVKIELSAHMAEFRSAGITHLGLEMFGSDHQPVLDAFFLTGDKSVESEICAILDSEWGWITEQYIALLRAAREAGIRPLAIDMPHAEEQALLDKRRAQGLSVGPAALFVPRDVHMVGTLGEFLREDPAARILVLAGIDHLEVSNQPDLLEKTYGISTRRYTLLWGGGDPLDVGIEGAKFSWKRLFIPFPRTLRGLDGIIAVPEIRKEGNGTGMLPGSPDD